MLVPFEAQDGVTGSSVAYRMDISRFSHPFLSQQLYSIFYLSEICYHRGAASTASGTSFGQQQVHFAAGWNWLSDRELLLVSPPTGHLSLPKSCCIKPIRLSKQFFFLKAVFAITLLFSVLFSFEC